MAKDTQSQKYVAEIWKNRYFWSFFSFLYNCEKSGNP